MKWLLALLVAGGIFYAAKRLMPSADAIDTQWVKTQLEVGMTTDQVAKIAGEPSYRQRHQVGTSDVWHYTDRFDPNDRLVIHFIEGSVYRIELENR